MRSTQQGGRNPSPGRSVIRAGGESAGKITVLGNIGFDLPTRTAG